MDREPILTIAQSLLIQLGVKECILPSDDKRADHELTKLRTLIQRCNIVVTERKPGTCIELDDRVAHIELTNVQPTF